MRSSQLSGHFFEKQSFFSSDLFRFWSLEYPRVRGPGWLGHTCVKNLSGVGVEVCTKFGGLLVKEGLRYMGTNTVSLKYIG